MFKFCVLLFLLSMKRSKKNAGMPLVIVWKLFSCLMLVMPERVKFTFSKAWSTKGVMLFMSSSKYFYLPSLFYFNFFKRQIRNEKMIYWNIYTLPTYINVHWIIHENNWSTYFNEKAKDAAWFFQQDSNRFCWYT